MSALGLTAAIRQRMLNYLQRLILILPFNPSHGDSFTSCMTPVETSTTPEFRCMGYADISVFILTHSFISVKLIPAYFLEKNYSILYNEINYTKKGVEFL